MPIAGGIEVRNGLGVGSYLGIPAGSASASGVWVGGPSPSHLPDHDSIRMGGRSFSLRHR